MRDLGGGRKDAAARHQRAGTDDDPLARPGERGGLGIQSAMTEQGRGDGAGACHTTRGACQRPGTGDNANADARQGGHASLQSARGRASRLTDARERSGLSSQRTD